MTASVFADEVEPRGGVPGACCDTVNMTCSIRDQTSCEAVGGVFAGDNTVCTDCFETSSSSLIYGIEDTFERQSAPEATYGSAGALNVSGPQARNGSNQLVGKTDTWMKFDPIPAIVQFDSVYGPGNWVIVSATLSLHEDNAPNHPIFGVGSGTFEIRWLASDNWSQGNGRPNSPGVPTGNQIGYTYGQSILNALTDESLGIFSHAGTFSYQQFNLPLSPGFVADLMTSDPVSLYFIGVDSRVGFTFNSSSHSNLPSINLVAEVAPPPPPCRGDVSEDTFIRGDDIQSYVEGYLNPGALSPYKFALIDMDNSGVADSADLDCFVAALLATHDCAGGPFVCP